MTEVGGTLGGRYVLAGEIASGGMATVHLARQLGDAGFARIVAVKRLHERYARDPEFVAMFLDEARLVARVRHPNVVQTVDVVSEGGELFLVMEYVHGESLLKLVQHANRTSVTLPVPVVAAIVAGALHGLHAAHDARSETGEPLGIVHRDVSPHNVLVGVDGVARVLDFGVAKASQRITSTQEGHLKGKISYMAPEQISGRPVDRRTDVYAAAVVMWEALTGTKLFEGASEGAILNQVIAAPLRSPLELNRGVPEELGAIVMRGLSRDQAERFATAGEMAEAIERATATATPAAIGQLVSTMCVTSVTARAQLIASIEARSSSVNERDAVDGLRSLASAGRGGTDPMGAPRGSRAPSLAPPRNPNPIPIPGPNHGLSHSPIQTWPSPGTAPAATLPPPPLVAHAPARGGAMAGAAAAAVLVASALAVGGYYFFTRGPDHDAPIASASSREAVSAITAAPEAGSPSAALTTVTSASAAAGASGATCPEGMASVPSGRFFMGSDDDLPAEKPAHKVELHAYCMDKFEVSANAYRACSARGDCKRAGVTNRWANITAKDARIYDPLCNANPDATGRGDHPINCVDWNMADRFCKAEGKRLPTEAEWEYAARGSDGRKYPWGDTPPSVKHLNACGAECTAWGKKHGAPLEGLFTESDDWATTAPVGSFPLGTSRWGIEDMVGNVWEWVADYYGPYGNADQDDPTGPASGETRGMRGGSWNGAYADWVRPSFRFHDVPGTRSYGVGFRCAKSL